MSQTMAVHKIVIMNTRSGVFPEKLLGNYDNIARSYMAQTLEQKKVFIPSVSNSSFV